jgi:hypothetical protein
MSVIPKRKTIAQELFNSECPFHQIPLRENSIALFPKTTTIIPTTPPPPKRNLLSVK